MEYFFRRLPIALFLAVCIIGTNATPAFAVPPASVAMSRSSLSHGQTATVTFTFLYAPLSFTTSDITAPNGSISNLAVTGNPLVYTATYTATSNSADASNVITVRGLVAGNTYGGLASGAAGVVFDGTNMWTSGAYSSSVSKITPLGATTTYSGTGGSPYSIAFDGTNTWTANGGGSSVTKISPTGTMTTYSGLGTNPFGIAYDGSNMWVANYGSDSVSKVTSSGTVTTYTGTGWGPFWIAFDNTNMWTANYNDSTVSKISPSGTVTTYSGVPGNPRQLAFDGTNMWTANSGAFSVSKISPSGTITTYSGLGGYPYTIGFDTTNMWTGNNNGSISKIAPDGTITNYYSVPTLPRGMAYDGSNMWVSSINDSSITKIIPMEEMSSPNFAITSSGGRGDVARTAPAALVLTVSDITTSSATISAHTSSPNGITSAGFDFGTDASNLSTKQSFVGGGQMSFSYNLTGLSCGNTYILRSFIKNAIATTQGDDVSFKTPSCAHTKPDASSVVSTPTSTGTSTLKASTTPALVEKPATLKFVRNLHRGMSGTDVVMLQVYLNTHGFQVASFGPGALGSESDYFGAATQAALAGFQKAKGIMPAVGYFGPLTQKTIAETL